MTTDGDVLAALRAAIAADPGNVTLRVHLAGLLLDSGDARAALDECVGVLAREPDHVRALRLAAQAAATVDDLDRAARYERMADAIESPTTAPTQPGPKHDVPVEALEHEEELDRFLAEVLHADPDAERSAVTLADVGGLEDVKRRLVSSFLAPARNPELRKLFGTSMRGGLLLYGPPGCGKTFLARAVAGELGARFFAVGLHEVLDMWLGQSERNLHEVFETARRCAPCVLFLDEVDALGMKRSNLSRSAGRNVVVQLLNELDGTMSRNEGLFVLAATNQPWDVDPALRRPGRLDRTLLVLPPDQPARRAILAYHLRGRPTAGVDVERLAARSEGYSGADLRLVCESAAEAALEASVAAGAARRIEMADLERALAEVRPSVRPWFEVARNYVLFANQDGSYDDLLAYLRRLKLT